LGARCRHAAEARPSLDDELEVIEATMREAISSVAARRH
jgi:hypothetical protein